MESINDITVYPMDQFRTQKIEGGQLWGWFLPSSGTVHFFIKRISWVQRPVYKIEKCYEVPRKLTSHKNYLP